MPPHAALHGSLEDSFHAAPNAAFPAGYIEILTNCKKNGQIEVSDVSFMGMNLEDDSFTTNPLQLANELDKKQQEDGMYGALTDSLIYACGGAACGVVDESYGCGVVSQGVECSYPELKPALKKENSIKVQPRKKKRRVNFSNLQIREHSMTLGDHPSAASGPPISLSWEKAAEDKVVDLDTYERGRNPRRSRRQLKMSFRDREEVLIKQGFTIDQVKQAWEDSLLVRQQRYETLMQGVFSTKFEEACQSANRKFWRLFNYDTA